MLGIRRYLIGAAALLVLFSGVWWYGSKQYDNGYAQARTDMLAESQAATAKAQKEKDLAEQKYRESIKAREDEQRIADSHIDRLNRLLATRSNNAKSPTSTSGTNGTREPGDVVLAECVREYRTMGEHAGRLADKVNGWIGYGEVMQRWGN